MRTDSLKQDLIEANINIETLKANNEDLIYSLEIYEDRLAYLVSQNNILEDDISNAQVFIDQLNTRSPEVIVREVYNTILPEDCTSKFSWMLSEAIRMKEPIQ